MSSCGFTLAREQLGPGLISLPLGPSAFDWGSSVDSPVQCPILYVPASRADFAVVSLSHRFLLSFSFALLGFELRASCTP
jgi:hypothetical protein